MTAKEITIEITDRCSLNCRHCSASAGKKGRAFRSMEEVVQLAGEHPDFEIVRISGGEPFEHPNLIGIVLALRRMGRRIIILSSGVKGEKPIPASEFARVGNGICEIIFSIHGFYDAHDRIVSDEPAWWNRPSFWEMLVESVSNAVSTGIERVSFQTVVLKENLHHLPMLAKTILHFSLALNRHFDWRLLRFVPQGRGRNLREQDADESLIDLIPIFCERVSRIGREHPRASVTATCSGSFGSGPCGCGTAKMAVTHQGRILPCSSMKEGRKCRGVSSVNYISD